jgi:hypothetical protein
MYPGVRTNEGHPEFIIEIVLQFVLFSLLLAAFCKNTFYHAPLPKYLELNR